MTNNLSSKIISALPYTKPFLFVDEIESVDNYSIKGNYTFPNENFFTLSHFKHKPVIPGVILLEMMGQIGMVSHLIFLNNLHIQKRSFLPILSHIESDFLIEIKPNEKGTVISEVIYFRHYVLKSKVQLFNSKKELSINSTAHVKLIFE